MYPEYQLKLKNMPLGVVPDPKVTAAGKSK